MIEFTATPGWARDSGVIDLGQAATGLSLRQISDRLLIQETINRYGWAYDERDMAALERTFAEDASYEGVVAGVGRFGPFVDRQAILGWFADYMSKHKDLRRHAMHNVIFVRQNDESATVNAYLALHRVENGNAVLAATGFYRIDLKKSDDCWVFARVFAGFDNSYA